MNRIAHITGLGGPRPVCRSYAAPFQVIMVALTCSLGSLPLSAAMEAPAEGEGLVSSSRQQDRAAKAQADFDAAVRSAPFRTLRATAYFAQGMQLDDAVERLRDQGLAIKAFRHSNATESGGYTLREGEPLEEAKQNYRADHARFLNRRVELLQGMLSDTNVPQTEEMRKELLRTLKEAETVQIEGLQIMGVEVEGVASDISKFKERSPFIRVIELVDRDRLHPAIIPAPK